MPPVRPALALTLALTALAGAAACHSEEPSRTGPTYLARCQIVVESTDEPTTHDLSARGPNAEVAERAAWSQLCQQLELPEGCQDDLPEGFRREGVACMGVSGFEGTGIRLADENTYNCTVHVSDARNVARGESEVVQRGSRDELANYSEELCGQAMAEACGQVGGEGDCTTGDPPRYRVVRHIADRRLAGSTD